MALQVIALSLVVSYYHLAPAQGAFTRLMELKLEIGPIFGVISTGVFAGLLPFLYLHSAKYRGGRAHYTWGQGLGLTAFWAYKGIEIDLLYRLLARWVGAGHGVATIAEKTLIDQGFTAPSWPCRRPCWSINGWRIISTTAPPWPISARRTGTGAGSCRC